MDSYDVNQAPPAKKSGKRKWLLLIVALLILAGIAAYFINKNNNKNTNTAASTQSTNQPANTFAPASTTGTPYVATISSNAGGQKTTAVMTSDGNGNVSYAYSKNGQNASIIYTADAYYLCSGTSQCIKYPISQSSSSGFDPSAYEFDSSRIDTLKNTAAYKGQQACPSPATGTCDVWSATSGGATSTIYISTSNHRVVKATSVSGTTTSDVTYDYKNATVAIPTNFTTVPTAQ